MKTVRSPCVPLGKVAKKERDAAAEIDGQAEDRAELDHDRKHLPVTVFEVDAEQRLGNAEVRRGTDGQEFGEPFDHTEDEGKENSRSRPHGSAGRNPEITLSCEHGHAKIVVTLGPASDSLETVTALIRAGAQIFRLNASHGHLGAASDNASNGSRRGETHRGSRRHPAGSAGPEDPAGEIRRGKCTLQTGARFIITTEEMMGDEHAGLDHLSTVRDGCAAWATACCSTMAR